MAELKFAESHNLAILLAEPPVDHNEFKSMIHGMKECCLASTLTLNPTIYQRLIREFWKSTTVKKKDDSVFIEALVKGCKIIVTEQIIRDVLNIDDQSSFPTEIELDQAQELLSNMGYEGDFPPTLKRLLPPYWRFLAHVFVSCISGRRSGADEISLRNAGAIAAGLDFNFSRFILDELVVNIQGKTKDKFLMYPRFLQIIINEQFPEIPKEGETLDMKSLGPNTVGLIKQNCKGKVTFEGKYPLVKFGIFVESSEASAYHESSDRMTVDDDVIIVSDHEESRVPSVATVAEEHELTSVHVQSDYSKSEDVDDEDLEDDDSLFGGNLSPHDDLELDLSFVDNFCPSHEDMESLFKNFGNDVQEATPPLVNQTADTSNPMDSTSGIPPLNVEIPTSVASASDPIKTHIFVPLLKRRRLDPRPRVLIQDLIQPVQPVLTTLTTTPTITTEPDHEHPRTTFEDGSSSALGNVSLTRPDHDIASERLARFYVEFETDLPSREKCISIGEGSMKGEDISKPELREEITVLKQKIIEKDLQIEDLDSHISVLEAESSLNSDQNFELQQDNAQKTKQISDLQLNLGALSASYFDLKNRLIVEFGDKFQTTAEGPSVSQAPITTPTATPTFEQNDNVPVRM
ncbi:hypothetical protein Lser_V15G16330 [Lactuca serriola]